MSLNRTQQRQDCSSWKVEGSASKCQWRIVRAIYKLKRGRAFLPLTSSSFYKFINIWLIEENAPFLLPKDPNPDGGITERRQPAPPNTAAGPEDGRSKVCFSMEEKFAGRKKENKECDYIQVLLNILTTSWPTEQFTEELNGHKIDTLVMGTALIWEENPTTFYWALGLGLTKLNAATNAWQMLSFLH